MCQLTRVCSVVFLGLLAVSCSDSNDSVSDMPADGGSLMEPDVGEANPDEDNPTGEDNPAGEDEGTDNNRAIVSEVMSIVDSTHFLGVELGSVVPFVTDGVNDCLGGGSSELTMTEAGKQIVFTSCRPWDDSAIEIGGDVVLIQDAGGTDFEMQFTQFEISDESQLVGVEGQLEVSSVEVATVVFSSGITITRGSTIADITDLEFSRIPDGVDSQNSANRISLSFAVTLTDPDAELTVSTSESMSSEVVSCPTSGSLLVVTDDDSNIDIMGAEGGNLTFSQQDDTQTLACTEIARVGL